ncbi:MAG: elongation factor Ts [Candidatus Aminicenantes bacterium]|nr:translation elongation factor Ts [Candidatus Aminicenantes bacterium]RLE00831.1 MAG: elongation factor Ts [Candidatus Aminicenantes bacterium]RLE04188.1 MAG: elongation factor Ts [Candidatus Aminicenantes bacterium]HHF42888.1 translation elongation factor Ts [Candidatus Aminicenantes bacterium]
MEIKADLVKQLRDRTGIGMMECKRALQEAEGDIEKAITILRKKGYARAKDKMSRETTEGLVGAYIHTNGKIGVLVEVNCETDFVARNEEFQALVKNIAMHIAAANPRYISPEDVEEEVIEQEKEIIREQFKDSNKPPQVIEKIIEGKLKKFYEEVCLLEQPYIRDDKITIAQLIATHIAKFGENIQVKRFSRFEIGQY